jgi:hypothetical protein
MIEMVSEDFVHVHSARLALAASDLKIIWPQAAGLVVVH